MERFKIIFSPHEYSGRGSDPNSEVRSPWSWRRRRRKISSLSCSTCSSISAALCDTAADGFKDGLTAEDGLAGSTVGGDDAFLVLPDLGCHTMDKWT